MVAYTNLHRFYSFGIAYNFKLRQCTCTVYLYIILNLMKRDKALEAILVITTGLLVFYIIYNHQILLYAAVASGVIGTFIKPLSSLIAKGWYKAGDLLGFIVSKVVLAVIFYLFLTPIAFLHNIINRDTLRLKKTDKSLWAERNQVYKSGDLKNIW